MKAAVLKQWEDIQLDEVTMPWPSKDEIVIRVAYAGICGSDKKIFKGQHDIVKPPVILSHEISGIIWDIPSQCSRTDLKKGDRVAVRPVISCGICPSCRSGRENICEDVKVLGIHEPGGLAEFLKAPAELVYKLPQTASLKAGALAEPIADALHHIYRSGFRIGKRTAVIGADFISLLIAYILNYAGASRAVVIDDSAYGRKMGNMLGLEVQEPSRLVCEDPKHFGTCIGEFDIVYESTGTLLGYRTMTNVLALGGTGVITGVPVQDVPVNIKQIFMKELSVIGCRLHTQEAFAGAVDLLGDRTFMEPLMKLITQQIDIEDLEYQKRDIFIDPGAGKTVIRVMREEEL